MKRVPTRLILSLIGLALIVVCAGCEATKVRAPEPAAAELGPVQPVITEPDVAPTPHPPPSPPSPRVTLPEGQYFVRTVKWHGESLSTIAAWYTGTTRNWRLLAEVNPQLADPNRIALGDRIRIPQKMLRTREAMPQGFAESYVKPPKQSGAGVARKDSEPVQ